MNNKPIIFEGEEYKDRFTALTRITPSFRMRMEFLFCVKTTIESESYTKVVMPVEKTIMHVHIYTIWDKLKSFFRNSQACAVESEKPQVEKLKKRSVEISLSNGTINSGKIPTTYQYNASDEQKNKFIDLLKSTGAVGMFSCTINETKQRALVWMDSDFNINVRPMNFEQIEHFITDSITITVKI